jgi:hypothetical protein
MVRVITINKGYLHVQYLYGSPCNGDFEGLICGRKSGIKIRYIKFRF